MATDTMAEIEDGVEDDQDMDQHDFEAEAKTWYLAPPEAASELQRIRNDFHSPRLDGCSIRLVFTHKDMKRDGKPVNGKAVKVPGMWKDLYGAAALVIIRASIWARYEREQLDANFLGRLLDHELCHLEWDGMKQSVKVVEAPHEFPQVIQRWGIDADDPLQQAIAEQLAMDL